ncbi:sulfotransferase [Rhodospirillaceae bacterium SYSU D60014]|uniref:sulfotransferase family protein n=1 Tax=Virgifigura deserti TaxID=2268457 RepID=UPI0013C47212
MTLPNFVVIGAFRSGTTSLYYYLRQHPQIFLSPIKETNFLAYDAETDSHRPDPLQRFRVRTFAHYEGLFSSAGKESAVGEVSPLYLARPLAADRIKQYMPDAKLIAILRNPADRAHAGYLAAVRRGSENRSLAEVVGDARHKKARNLPGAPYIEAGFYHQNLMFYLDRFSREQITLYLYDDFRSDAGAVLRSIFRFLKVDENFAPDMSIKFNASGLPRNKLLDRLLQPTMFTKTVQARLPDWVRRPIYAGVTAINRRNLVKPELPSAVRQDLTALYKDDILKLQGLLGRDLGHWLA